MEGGGGSMSGIRQRMTLSDQLHSVNLGDLLKVGDIDESNGRRGSRGAVTLATVLQSDKKKTCTCASASTASNASNASNVGGRRGGGGGGRTLLDAIREDEDEDEDKEERGGGGEGGVMISRWGDLRDGMEFGSRDDETRRSWELDRRSSSGSGSGSGSTTVRVSLMTLMELQLGESSSSSSSSSNSCEEEEEEEKEEQQQQQQQVYYNKCCCCCCCVVCMVREKGAAFIPCGHTFCRVCSQHLFMARRNCPLCNASILDVLHIF